MVDEIDMMIIVDVIAAVQKKEEEKLRTSVN